MLKKIIRLIFVFLTTLAHKSYGVEGVNALLLLMPAKLIVPTLRRYGAEIGEDTILHSPLIIHNAGENYRNLSVGSRCYFGRDILFDLKDQIAIGDRVTVSMRVTLITHTDLGESDGKKTLPPSKARIKIDSGAYLGANVTVLQGVHIHQGAVAGAGSIVLHDIPPNSLAAGNPAKVIKTIDG